jgi:hypothetical protein
MRTSNTMLATAFLALLPRILNSAQSATLGGDRRISGFPRIFSLLMQAGKCAKKRAPLRNFSYWL